MQRFILCMLLSYAVEFSASFFTQATLQGWYAELQKPFWNPPNYLFPIVWTLLYTLMGIASFLIVDKEKNFFCQPMKPYYLQLVFNFAWPLCFFYFKQPGLGLFVILALLYTIWLSIQAFYKVKPLAAYLLLPYFLWVLYATTLNIGFVYLNDF